MAEAAGERLQPSLLDRLTDDAPRQSEETYEQSTISDGQLRDFVLRDILWLFNTANDARNLAAYPEASDSVLNFGIRPFAGVSSGEIMKDATAIQEALRRAIEVFEPRISNLSVQLDVSQADMKNPEPSFDIVVSGELWGRPVSLIELRTEFDLESGEVTIEDVR